MSNGAATGGSSGASGAAGAAGAAGGAGTAGAASGTSAGASGGAGASGAASGSAAAGGTSAGVINSNQTTSTGNGTGSAQTGTAPVSWDAALSDDHKGYVQNKGWKAPTDMVDSYRNLEKMVGVPADQILKLPKADDAAGMEAIYSKLGRPATPEGYKLSPPKDGGSPEFTKWAAEAYHKANLTESQAKALTEQWNQHFEGQSKTQKQTSEIQGQADALSLKKEWGAAHEQNMNVARRAAREFGIDGATLDALDSAVGHAKTMKLLQSIGSKLGEASFVGGNNSGQSGNMNGPMTPAQANAKIKELRSDADFVKRYTQGGTGSKEFAQMQTLHQFANPDLH